MFGEDIASKNIFRAGEMLGEIFCRLTCVEVIDFAFFATSPIYGSCLRVGMHF